MPWLIVSPTQEDNIRIMGELGTTGIKNNKARSREKSYPVDILQRSQTLEHILKSKSGMPAFQAFLKTEFSYENIEFWLICEDYKKIRCSSRRTSRAKKIFESYIEANSPKEINIDHQTRDLIRQKMKTPDGSCFDQAQQIVFSLMERDSYPRFLRSDIYNSLTSYTQT